MKKWQFAIVAAGAALTLVLIDSWFFYLRWFDAPPVDTGAPRPASELVEQGAYLVNGPGRCADCHGDPARRREIARGQVVPLSGGFSEKIYLGEIIFPNITPERQTGIGSLDADGIHRFFRSGINHRGEYGLPFMNYERLTPGDITAILAYLRSQPAVRHEVARSRYNLLGRFALAWFIRPPEPPPAFRDNHAGEVSAERGRYLAEALGSCRDCHTDRSLYTGEFTGPAYGGGMPFTNPDDPEELILSPDLRPDRDGEVARLGREAFVRRFQSGAMREWSPMPWGPFSRMTRPDLESLYLYLAQLPPAGE